MVSISSEQSEVIRDVLEQIKQGIVNLQEWNKDLADMNSLLMCPNGMQSLAGNCMIIMAIAEGFKKIDRYSDGSLLPLRPEIPWKQVFGLRNRIAHGYFDIDAEVISEVIKNDLSPLLAATNFFLEYLA